MIIEGGTADDIHKLAVEQGMVTLRRSGIRKALEGETTLEEVLRVVRMSPSAATRVEWARRLAQSIVSDGYATDADVDTGARRGRPTGARRSRPCSSPRDVTSQEVVLGLLSQITQLPVVDLDHDRPERPGAGVDAC